MKKAWRRVRWALLAVAALGAIVIAAPFLVPLEGLIPELSRIASEKLGQPVVIAGLRLHLFPTPRGVATGIEIGKKAEVTVGELQIVPDLLSLVSGPKAIRLVRAEDVNVKEAALAFPGKMPRSAGGEDIAVRRVELRNMKLEHSAVKLPEFDLRVGLGDTLSVMLESAQWTLSAEGTLKGQVLDLPRIEGRLYGGKLNGSVRADWNRQWQLSGKASLSGVDIAPLQRALGKKVQLTGRLNTDATFSSRARSPDQLAGALVLDGPFEVVGGAYQGYDLSKISFTGLEPGGSTRFDELKGKLEVRAKQTRIAALCARSPVLVAGGNVDIAADQKLSGKLDVSVSKTGGFVGMPVSLGGTTSDPSFRPTKGAMIGAAVGTVFLPGIGTTIGSSLGSRIEGTSDCK